ncbi:hypothetical protein [Glaciihabitans sp. dw_435]|uniref:hypothetical protein n=1 Tax=Glaciihabitans sp. dw_435 TaxID=2720081 RepID=UPI001BD63669|nr:hypothetical protein [Glaciihabitans sp. dw_435]
MGKRRTLTIIGSSALALGLLALIAWPIVAAGQRGAVLVYPDAKAFVCETGDVSYLEDSDEHDPAFTQSLALTKDLDCDLRFHVLNNSSTTVQLSGATYEMFGPSVGAGVNVDRIDGQPSRFVNEGRDAQWVMRHPIAIEPGSEFFLVAHVVFNPNSCLGLQAYEIDDSPILTISALGIAGARVTGYGAVAFTGTAQSDGGC